MKWHCQKSFQRFHSKRIFFNMLQMRQFPAHIAILGFLLFAKIDTSVSLRCYQCASESEGSCAKDLSESMLVECSPSIEAVTEGPDTTIALCTSTGTPYNEEVLNNDVLFSKEQSVSDDFSKEQSQYVCATGLFVTEMDNDRKTIITRNCVPKNEATCNDIKSPYIADCKVSSCNEDNCNGASMDLL